MQMFQNKIINNNNKKKDAACVRDFHDCTENSWCILSVKLCVIQLTDTMDTLTMSKHFLSTNFSGETVQWTNLIFCVFPNVFSPFILSGSSTLYFPSPPLLLIKIQLWVKSLAGKSVCRPGSALW